MTNDPKNPQILISDRDSGLPYSKGLMASQVMVTGLSPVRAYQVAEAIEERLRELGVPSISNAQLGELALGVLEDLAGERYARNFQRWREVEALKVPLVVLIGGRRGSASRRWRPSSRLAWGSSGWSRPMRSAR